LSVPGGWAFDYAGDYPWAFGTWFATLNPNMEDFIEKDQQFVAD